jgi:hypothetical protein
MTNLLDDWRVTPEQLTAILGENPSLRGMLQGYVAEWKLRDYLLSLPDVTAIRKPDDHDRQEKGDLYVTYRGRLYRLEVKSLQTATVKWDAAANQWHGKAQVDASDRRLIRLPDGSTLQTTLLLRGEFDILAVNCFAFTQKWDFLFARNEDLPSSTFRNYSETQRANLIASLIPVTWPPSAPFVTDIRELFPA